jgi:hypothetical protein
MITPIIGNDALDFENEKKLLTSSHHFCTLLGPNGKIWLIIYTLQVRKCPTTGALERCPAFSLCQ